MRRTTAAAFVLVTALFIAAAGQAAKDPFNGARDSAVGSGTYGPGCAIELPPTKDPFCLTTQVRRFAFSATSDPLGGDAQGTWTTDTTPTRHWAGTITCLNVAGNTASFGGVITESPNPSAVPPGTPFIEYVVDNTQVDPALPDLISPFAILPPGDPDLANVPADFPATCPPPVPSLAGYFPVTSGDIAVTDSSCGEVKTNPNGKVKCKHPFTTP